MRTYLDIFLELLLHITPLTAKKNQLINILTLTHFNGANHVPPNRVASFTCDEDINQWYWSSKNPPK